MKRKIIDRVLDRIWREIGSRTALDPAHLKPGGGNGADSSISSGMPWKNVCGMLADGSLPSRNFRKLRAVRNVVETVGLSDSRFYAALIRRWEPEWLEHPKVADVDDWGIRSVPPVSFSAHPGPSARRH